MAIDLTAVVVSSEDHALARSGGLRLPGRRPRMTRRDRKFFTEQLGLLLETGTPLVSALDLIARQASNPALEDAVGGIAEAVREGSTFAAALRARPDAFPATYATLIEASERGGYIDRVLGHLLTMEENREELESNVISAFTYPAFLTVFSGAVVIFILAFVFRGFLVEAFVIPTGSMAPTLYGKHGTQICPDCGWEYAYGLPDRHPERQKIKCPNCERGSAGHIELPYHAPGRRCGEYDRWFRPDLERSNPRLAERVSHLSFEPQSGDRILVF